MSLYFIRATKTVGDTELEREVRRGKRVSVGNGTLYSSPSAARRALLSIGWAYPDWRVEVLPYRLKLAVGNDVTYIGIHIHGDGVRRFWQIICPCGITAEYPINGLPEIDTPHPCGNPEHWAVKYD